MKLSKLMQILTEELQKFFKESWVDDYVYQKYGLKKDKPEFQQNHPHDKQNEPADFSKGQLMGYIESGWNRKFKTPVAVYKNPMDLEEFEDIRGILVSDGNFYVADSNAIIHYDIINYLGDLGAIPQISVMTNYAVRLPKEYVAVVRDGMKFIPSSAYDKENFPEYYKKMFELANTRPWRYKFIYKWAEAV